MADLKLGPMLRHVTATTATIWVETDVPCTVEVMGHRAPTFTVGRRHYALVIVRDLTPESIIPYEVHLDGERRWPEPDSAFPPSVIRTMVDRRPVRILFGSCRASGPHDPPRPDGPPRDDDPKGVDALWAHATRMLGQAPETWPDLAIFIGDQVYADDSPPRVAERIERRRARQDDPDDPPDDIVADFEEYTWLYHEAWSPPVERWFFSVVPSAMIFDDHDVIDDWNISDSWVRDIRAEPWWQEHIVGGLVSYWIYQHLGNLSPDEIAAEGMLAELEEAVDGTLLLRRWAEESEGFTPVPGGYRFSHSRDVGGVRLVVVDSRNGRVLDPSDRRMVDLDEWAWVCEHALRPCDHLVMATSLPVFVPGGVHALQQWNEAVCAGAWGTRLARWGERVRRRIDLEGWPAFHRSFDDMVALLQRATSSEDGRVAPATTTVVSGDIHFAFVADVGVAPEDPHGAVVHQVVSSPIRNALGRGERTAVRTAASRAGSALGRILVRSARRPPAAHSFRVDHGPVFDNNIGLLVFGEDGTDRGARVIIETARWDGDAAVLESVIDLPL